MSRISRLTQSYSLSASEAARLYAVLDYFSEDDWDAELKEELKCIMGDRKLRTMKLLTAEQVDIAAKVIESGASRFVPQAVE